MAITSRGQLVRVTVIRLTHLAGMLRTQGKLPL
jgi:hypothetical protein